MDRANRRPGADLTASGLTPRLALLCFAATFAVYLAFIPRVLLYSSPPTGDQAYYLIETISLVQDGDFNVANNYAQHDEDKFYSLAPHPPGFVGIAAPYPLPPQLARATARPDTEWYGYHLPGLSLMLAPAWIIGSWFSLWWPATMVLMCAIGALVAVNIFLLAHETAGRLRISIPVWLGLAFSGPLMTYSYVIFTELPTGLLLIYAFRRLELGWLANSRWRLMLVGACIGFIPWLAWRCALISLSLAVLALVQWWRSRPAGTRGPAGLSSLAWVVAPGALSAVLLVAYNLYLFGRPIPSVTVPELGDRPPFHFPWTGVEAFTATITDAFALLFDRQMGLVTYTPVVILAVVGVIAMWRSRNPADLRLLFAVALIILPYFGLIASFHFWNGIWNPPARYQTTLVPVLAVPLAMSLRSASRWFRLVFMLLAAPGVLLALAMLADARRLWPTYPVFGWLATGSDLPLHMDLRGFLPAFSPVDDVRLPPSTAGVILASFAIILGSQFLRRGPVLRPTRRTAFAWLCAASVLGGGWYVTNAEYVKRWTLLTELHRWSLPTTLEESRGLARLDGTVYITAYRSGTLLAFDLASGGSPRFLVSAPPGGAVRERPSDVQVGPDGLLYVLNNGEATRAVLVLNPDGQVVRQIPLDDRSNITMGLSIGPAGQLHVGDMVGGRILTYSADGGRPTSAWGGLTGGFNNVSGIALAPDGSVYAAEASAHRIQQLAADGHALRTFELDCEPQYVVLAGDWLDATCGAGLLSINTAAGYRQRTRVVDRSTEFEHPRGLAYGPDNTLFVVDEHKLFQFSIQH
jgi:sugar lactone lactonase YvrE